MFPTELRFHVHPRELQAAAELLPEPKGQVRRTASASEELKNKLLQVPVEKLKLWKMKPKMLSKLPYLLVEQDNAELQKRIIAISIASIDNCSEEILVFLLGYLYRKKEFVQALNARLIKNPPTKNTWLQKNYKVFRVEEPAAHLAKLLLQDVDDITQLAEQVRIPTSSPLFERIFVYYAREYDWKRLHRSSYSRVLQFVEGSAPLQVKQKLLLEVLKEYCSPNLTISVLETGSPLRPLLQRARVVFGSLSGPIWKAIPQAQRFAKLLWIEKRLDIYFGVGDSFARRRWWRQWIETIEDIIVHRPSSLVCIYVGNFVVVESLASPQWMYIYEQRTFMLQVQPKLWERSPFQIQLEAQVIERKKGWQDLCNGWMIQQGFRRSEEW